LKKQLRIDKTAQCVGCRQCELACSVLHEGAFAPWLSRVVVRREESILLAQPTICYQCKQAKCESACPTEAITRNEDGVLVVDPELCNGCGKCVIACPFHAMGMNHVQNRAYKCDLCGGDPECVKVCPAYVLLWVEVP
jgi:carbon-monoxide dehydrogenase iron sulfur subunit